ncbi:hypothetical protein SAMN05444372_10765 [Flavobacterium micromati]|uniref:Uncharacterized protein n=1 Tax=Flavobacterium micromati TaxID=229205 RepID=A0A1M5KRR9_9FLAO|nr:hypothetical protein SAMN05444372_10765 [Flavobacterium micromati]
MVISVLRLKIIKSLMIVYYFKMVAMWIFIFTDTVYLIINEIAISKSSAAIIKLDKKLIPDCRFSN